jgi:hypothetical protein
MKLNQSRQKDIEYISYDRQTRSSWAVLLKNLSDVPDHFRPFFQSLPEIVKHFPYSVLTPTYEGFGFHIQQRLICLIDHCLYLAQKGEDSTQALCLPFANIHHVEFKTVLLDSLLHIAGKDQNGQPAQIDIRFNSVSDDLFRKIVDLIRLTAFNASESKSPFSFSQLKEANFKMANFARTSLLKGEHVDQLIWQPALRESRIRIQIPSLVNTFLYRTVFPHHVTMLTNQELILIHESERVVSDDCYGGVWDYIPRNKIKNISMIHDPDGLIALSVDLPEAESIKTRYLPGMQTELESLVNKFN